MEACNAATYQEDQDSLLRLKCWRLSPEQIADVHNQEPFSRQAAAAPAPSSADSLNNDLAQFIVQ